MVAKYVLTKYIWKQFIDLTWEEKVQVIRKYKVLENIIVIDRDADDFWFSESDLEKLDLSESTLKDIIVDIALMGY